MVGQDQVVGPRLQSAAVLPTFMALFTAILDLIVQRCDFVAVVMRFANRLMRVIP